MKTVTVIDVNAQVIDRFNTRRPVCKAMRARAYQNVRLDFYGRGYAKGGLTFIY